LQAIDCSDRPYLLRALEADDPLYRPLMAEINGTLYLVDILYRMLMPRELAAAMSFPADYVFVGSNSDQVRMIGNAVPVELATELCYSMLGRN
jgi:site-specific DNA-cytosine methylase